MRTCQAFEQRGTGQAVRAPAVSTKRFFNASVTKTFPIAQTGAEGFIRADYSHRGNSFADVPNEPPGAEFRSGSFDLINLRAGVKFQNWEFQVYAQNLTNQDATAWDWYDGFFHFRALIPPRTYGLNVKFHYN